MGSTEFNKLSLSGSFYANKIFVIILCKSHLFKKIVNFPEHYLTVNFKSSASVFTEINSKQLWLVRMDWHITLSEGV